jgi:predicted MPP superfamily phosphohydrolase
MTGGNEVQNTTQRGSHSIDLTGKNATAPERSRRAPGVPLRMAGFITLFIGAWLGLPWLVVSLFMAGVVPGGWWTLSGLLVFALSAIVARVQGMRGRVAPNGMMRTLLLMPFTYLFLSLPLIALASLLGALLAWPLVGPLAGGRFAIELAVIVMSALGVAGYFGSRRLVVKRIEVEHARVPAEFDGLRIVHLTDLHVGPHTSRSFLARVAAEVERLEPDLIAFTGDQVDDYAADTDHFVRAFGHLRAPLGVFAIPGNHDVYAGWESVEARLRSAGLHVLVNEGMSFTRGEATLWVGGTGDPAAGRFDGTGPAPDVGKTMASAPSDAFRLVLAHNPALWKGLAQHDAHLTLSGHTHYGQLAIPACEWSMASAFLEHSMGRYEAGESILYINPGTNYWGIPFRLGAWPEITLVTLRRQGQPHKPKTASN